MAGLVLKIDSEASENRIHRPDPSKPPTPVHAEAAVGQLHQRLDMVPLELPRRCHLLKFFSHSDLKLASPRGVGLLKVVSGQNPREIALEVLQKRENARKTGR